METKTAMNERRYKDRAIVDLWHPRAAIDEVSFGKGRRDHFA
jgi:hypothetical protein